MADTVWTAGGRRLAVEVFGDPDGIPVFLMHGTPGSRLGQHPRGQLLHRLGVRLIAFDRPGYGRSGTAGEWWLIRAVQADIRMYADHS